MDDPVARARARMLDEIRADAAQTASWTGRAVFADSVMAAMDAVPRHEFVTPGDEACAYINRPRGIGHGQTISQPYIVALMTDLLDAEPHHKALEVGTGCGYQAAVLSRVVGQVFSLEIVETLAKSAAERLDRLGYANIRVRHADGHDGWAGEAPFDRIIVTAAARAVPETLLAQLKPGGRMVIPRRTSSYISPTRVCAGSSRA